MPPERPIAHRIYFPDLAGHGIGSELGLDGPEAHHAVRVKRARVGERIALFDGRGRVATGDVTGVRIGKNASIDVTIDAARDDPPLRPRLEVWCPPPKGDRLETMIDQLSQIGAARWRPLRTARSERDAFRPDKLERASVESAKQCGRAHLLEIGEWIAFDDAVRDPRARLADASGEPGAPATGDVALILGPEGGWTDPERALAGEVGCPTVRFGAHVMRIETAAVAGASCLLAHACHSAVPVSEPNPTEGNHS